MVMKRSRWLLKRGKMVPHILEEDVVQEIKTRIWFDYRIRLFRIRERVPGRWALSEAGLPDLMGWLPNLNGPRAVPLSIECKRPGGTRRRAQIVFIDEARKDGCIAFFAESYTDVIRELQAQAGLKLKEAA